jgi:cytochrome c5
MRIKLLIGVVIVSMGAPFAQAVEYYDRSRDAIDERTRPIGRVQQLQSEAAEEPAAATEAAAAAAPPSGEQIYQQYCALCHVGGVAGAPQLEDKSEWEKRKAQGEEVLLQHVTHGYNAMPAKGTCMTCSEADLKATIEYMLRQAGL